MIVGRRLKGLIALGLFAAAFVVAYAQPGNPFSDTMIVRAQFDNAPALSYGRIDRNVRMDGVNVGEIGEVTRAEGSDDSIVELKLEKDEAGQISNDASAQVRPHTAFEGNSFIELDPGSPSAPPLGDEVIPPSRTRSYVAVEDVLRVARPDTREALKDNVRDLNTALGGGVPDSLQRTFHNLPPLFRDGAPAGRAAQGEHGDELRGVIRGLAATTESLARNERDLAPLLRQGDRTLDAINVDSGVALDAMLVEAPAALTRMATGGRELTRILDRLEPLSIDLRRALGEATPALRELRPLLRELRPIAAATPPLVDDLRLALANGARSAEPTRLLLTDLEPALVRLDDRVLPKLHESMRTAAEPGRRYSLAPDNIAPAFDVPVYQMLLRGLGESASGGISAVITPEQSARIPSTPGVGHAFRFGAQAFFPLGSAEGQPLPPCSSLAAEIQAVAQRFGLCDLGSE